MKGLEPLWFSTVPWQQSLGELCIAAMGPEQLQPQQAAQNPCGGTVSQAHAWWVQSALGRAVGIGELAGTVGQEKHIAAVLAVDCPAPGGWKLS